MTPNEKYDFKEVKHSTLNHMSCTHKHNTKELGQCVFKGYYGSVSEIHCALLYQQV